jgi:hypothetical protein
MKTMKKILLGLFIASIVILKSNFTNAQNTLTGTNAGNSLTTGDFNVFTGFCSGFSTTNSNYNTFTGYKSGLLSTSGGNTFTGALSGRENATGAYNTFTGWTSGYLNTTGNWNTFNGSSSGYSNRSGDYNVFNGYGAGYDNTTGFCNVFNGALSGRSNTSGSYNVFNGYHAGYNNTTGDRNVFIGYEAGQTNSLGNNNLCIGYGADLSNSNLTNATAIGHGATVSASHSLVLGYNVNVGIGTSAPAYKLQLNTAGAAKPGTSTWTIASDQRFKKDVTDFTDGLSVLEKIHPVWFSYNGEAGMPVDKKFVGIIAQEMKEIAPYMVGTFNHQDTLGNKTEYLDYDANALFYILVNSVKQQQATIEAMQDQITKLIAATNQDIENTSALDETSVCCDAALEQNYPNPFNESTIIKYSIGKNANSAFIIISSIDGREIQRHTINITNNGQIVIPANVLATGNYFYKLIVDGKQMDVKRMEIIK